MRLAILISLLSVALLAGCAIQKRADPRESINKYKPEWLPKSAKIVFSSQWEGGFLGDATIKLKAKVTEEEFTAVTKQLDLSPHTKERKYTDDIAGLQWMGDRDGRWDPPSTDVGKFVRQEGHFWRMMKYENGFLYYQAFSH